MFSKLVLCRVKFCRPDILGEFAQFAQGEPLAIVPAAWGDEEGLSHYGFVLSGMGLRQVTALKEYCDASPKSSLTCHDLGSGKASRTVEEALQAVGLRLHPAP